MKNHKSNPVGIYEKALPVDISWQQRLRLAAETGFDFIEFSIDESDARLNRLDWDKKQRKEFAQLLIDAPIPLLDLCLSAHRRFPLGSADPAIRKKGLEILHKAIDFAAEFGIRFIQVMGYYVYYEEENENSQSYFLDGLHRGLEYAIKNGVMLAIETVDINHVNSVHKAMKFVRLLNSPWFQVYPDIGNLTEQGMDVEEELKCGQGHIVAVHIKDVIQGEVRRIPFGEGIVDFNKAFTVLAKLAYGGPFLIEMWSDNSPQSMQIVSTALRFVREKMRIAGLSVID